MICPKCSSENRPGAKFCDECGAALCDANVDTSAEQALPSESAAQTVVLPVIEPSCTCDQEQSEDTTEEGFDYSDPTFSFDELPVVNEEFFASSGENENEGFADNCALQNDGEEEVSSALSAEATIDLKQLRELLPETEPENEAFSGFEQSNYEEMALVTPWEKGATMKMKPVEATGDAKADKQRTFVSGEDDAKPHKSKEPLIITLIVVLIAAAAAFGTWYFELWGGYKVPDVVGMSQESAQSVLTEKGFNIRVEQVKSDDEEGVVLLTDPQAGARLNEGGEVVLHVSVSRTMPSIVGSTKDDADAKLKAEGFVNITYKTEKSNEPEASVLSVSPEVGSKLKASYPITVVVAEPYRVPEVVGKGKDEATALLEEEGYVVAVKRVYTEQESEGTVLSTDPQADVKLNSGETVTISVAVSRERELVNVAQGAFASGTRHTVSGVNYEVSALSSVSYQGNDVTAVHVTARPYTVFLGVTMFLDPTDYTWTVTWTSDNQIASIS